jgi:hypothetical protein
MSDSKVHAIAWLPLCCLHTKDKTVQNTRKQNTHALDNYISKWILWYGQDTKLKGYK